MGVLNLLAFQGIKNDSGHLLDLNPNKAGLFKGSFSWDWGGGSVWSPLHISRRTNLISIQLVKQSIQSMLKVKNSDIICYKLTSLIFL